MRTSVGFNAPPPTLTTIPSPPSFQKHASLSHSAWHSPVPYLFGGLAAMLGLIAFALLILACSYWKLSGYLDGGEDADNGENNGNKDSATDDLKPAPCFEQRIVVIMAGDEKPTFLATPISSRASSFGENGSCSDHGKRVNGNSNGDGEVGGKKVVEGGEGVELNETEERGNDQNTQGHEQ